MRLPTVNIVSKNAEQGAYIVIDENDFDEKTMELYEGELNSEAPVIAATDSPPDMAAFMAEFAEMKAKLAALEAPGAEGWNKPPAP